jgi:molecular chaperone GrpE (heat shock protein)
MNAAKNQNDDLLKILDGADFSGMLAAREQAHQAEVRSILLGFLEVLDAVDRAAFRQEGGATLRIIQRQLVNTCEKAGVSFFNSKGKPFDPLRHRAIESRVGKVAAEKVSEEVTRGCEWNGKLLRPAGVVVVRSK